MPTGLAFHSRSNTRAEAQRAIVNGRSFAGSDAVGHVLARRALQQTTTKHDVFDFGRIDRRRAVQCGSGRVRHRYAMCLIEYAASSLGDPSAAIADNCASLM